MNNLGAKKVQKCFTIFCESGILLKSYGQFPDYLIASEIIPHVLGCVLTCLCLSINFFAKNFLLNRVRVGKRFLDNFDNWSNDDVMMMTHTFTSDKLKVWDLSFAFAYVNNVQILLANEKSNFKNIMEIREFSQIKGVSLS